MMFRRWGFYGASIAFLGLPAFPQAVVSARAGLVHFSEGSVFLDDQKVEQTFGRFGQMKDGSELRTEEGRAEVILGPDVFLRLGENSAIRMLSNRLQDTRIELLTGSVAVDSQSAVIKDPLIILWSGYQVQLREPGRYRVDAAPAQLKVENGKAEVSRGGASAVIKANYTVPFSGELVAERSVDQTPDGLDSWNSARTNAIAENNAQTGKATDLSAAMENWQNDPNAFFGALGTPGYLPSLGYVSPSYAPLSTYGVQAPYYQLMGPGLYSPYSSLWGIGGVSPLLLYPRPALGSYSYPYPSSIGLGSSALPRHGALGTGPYTHAPMAVRPIAPIRSGVGVGRVGAHR